MSTVNTWASKLTELERTLGKLPVIVKIAVLVEICPAELRNQLYAKHFDIAQVTETTLDELQQFS